MIEAIWDALHFQELSGQALFDIGILAVLVYQLLLLIRGTRAVHMLIGVAALVALHLLTGPGALHLPALHTVLGTMLLYIPFAIIVLFQNQIRQALARAGVKPLSAFAPKRERRDLAEQVALAAASLASRRVGALIVIERELGLRAFYETGIELEAVASYDLLMNIFSPGTPLHDGAVIIAEGRIKAASCYLPVTMDPTLSRAYGTRHRAAIGITEESDAVAVSVSEERGTVSLTEAGKIIDGITAPELAEKLRAALTPKAEAKERGPLRSKLPAPRRGDA